MLIYKYLSMILHKEYMCFYDYIYLIISYICIILSFKSRQNYLFFYSFGEIRLFKTRQNYQKINTYGEF
jgi:hypothetical protein